MLFEVFTGDRLVDEQDQATLWARVLNPKHRPPRSVLPSLPPEIDEMIMRAVAVEPRDRFDKALDMQRFADKLRTPESNKDTFIKYLRYLYPKIDFAAPPIPDFSELALQGTDRSLIIATSRESQRSVFGRGALPIEGTTTINAEELRRAFKSRQSREVATDPHITEKAPQAIDPDRPQRVITSDPAEEMIQPTGVAGPLMTIDGPTQIAHIPQLPGAMSPDLDFDEETRAASPMVRSLPSDDSIDEPSDHTLEAAPVQGLRSDSLSYRDDEMTVMMDAPPRHLTEDSDPKVPASNDETKLSRLPKPDVLKITPASATPTPGPSPAPNPGSNRGREIKERVSAQGAERHDRMEPRAEPPREPRAVRGDRGIEIHRQTVPIEQMPKPQQRSKPSDRGFSAPEMTEPEVTPPRGSNLLLPGLILFGLAVMIVILVLILIKMG